MNTTGKTVSALAVVAVFATVGTFYFSQNTDSNFDSEPIEVAVVDTTDVAAPWVLRDTVTQAVDFATVETDTVEEDPEKWSRTENVGDPNDPRTVAWVCAKYPDLVQKLIQSVDPERPDAQTLRRYVEERDWPSACVWLLDRAHLREKMIRPWDDLAPGGDGSNDWIPAGSTNYNVARANRVLADTIYVDYVEGYVPRTKYGGLNWECRGPRDSREWAWGLNRHVHFTWLKAAYLATGDTRYVARIDEELRDWILNSPYPGKKSATPQWRGLEAAERTRQWMQVWDLFGPDEISASTQILMLTSLLDHADYLRRYHADGTNWVLGEMIALATIAVTWPVFADAPVWIEYATAEMERQVKDQVYPDGAQVELTGHYHRIIAMEMSKFIDMVGRVEGMDELADANIGASVEEVSRKCDDLWTYLALTMRPNGTSLLNNDSDLRDLSTLAEEHGWDAKRPTGNPSLVFPWAGHVILRSSWDTDALWSFFDIGPWGVAHQHDDKLHLSVSAFGRDLLVDSGRFTYTPGAWRNYFTSSTSHNVILVDGAGQKRDRKRVDEPVSENDYAIGDVLSFARGTFDAGYDATQGNAEHTRVIVFVDNAYWVVADRVITDRPRRLDALWHFHPECSVMSDGKDVVTKDRGKGNLRLVPVSALDWEHSVISGSEKPIQGWYSANMNRKEESSAAVYTARISQSTAFAWILLPAKGDVPVVHARLESPALSRLSLIVKSGGVERRIDIPFDHGPPSVHTQR